MGWLCTRYSFSFAEYHDASRMGFGVLRVINDDVIEGGKGFEMHPHRNMEIVTIVTDGTLKHEDSEGHKGIIKAGEIQYMSAGKGIFHSEYNAAHTEAVKLLQVWILPREKGGMPCYDQRTFTDQEDATQVFLISPDGRNGSIAIKQDAFISLVTLQAGEEMLCVPIMPGHGRLFFVLDGEVMIDGEILHVRDEGQLIGEKDVMIRGIKKTKILVFEVPMVNV